MSGSTLSNNVITVQTVKQKSLKKTPNKILRLVNILIALRAIYE